MTAARRSLRLGACLALLTLLSPIPAADAGGAQVWRAPGPSGQAVAVSPDGSRVYVAGENDSDYETVAYDSANGAQLWTANYGRAAADDQPSAVAVSPDGSKVFVTGGSEGSTSYDYATIAYDASSGSRIWLARYDGPSANTDIATSLAVNALGTRIFITGAADRFKDFATIAYEAASGSELWRTRYRGPSAHGGTCDSPSLVLSPDQHRLFVTGGNWGGRKNYDDYATVAYSTDTGDRLWASRYDGPGSYEDCSRSIAVSTDGSRVYVTGGSRGNDTNSSDYATLAYAAGDGRKVWLARYEGDKRYSDNSASSIVVEPGGGSVFVTGTSSCDYATIAYRASDGARRWAVRYDGSGTHSAATSLATSPGGRHVYVTGSVRDPRSSGENPADDYATLAYLAKNGQKLWAARPRSADHFNDDDAYDIAVDPRGTQVYVTGSSESGKATVAYLTT